MSQARRDWIEVVSSAIDAKASEKFASFFTADGVFRFGNQPAVSGRTAVAGYVDAFFGMISSSQHKLVAVHESGDCVTWQGEVTYTRLDGNKVDIHFCNVLKMQGDLCAEYLIYIDNGPVFAPWEG
mmetsp:Transcript_12001/g.26337  ORF Transcript_12001/g.26337 Transcript_12001/m.26337 type:complete len:126 (-) Transcript_12001:126-503(-)